MTECIYMCSPGGGMGSAVAVSAFFFCGSAAFAALGLNNPLRRLFFTTALCLLAVFFLVVKRFLATSYSYAVYYDTERGHRELVVYEHTLAQRTPRAVCRVASYDVTGVEVCDGGKESKKRLKAATEGVEDFYNYTVSVLEKRHVTVIFSDGDRVGAARLSYDKGLVDIIGEKGLYR